MTISEKQIPKIQFYFQTKDVVNCLRSVEPLLKTEEFEKMTNDMLNNMQNKMVPKQQES